MDNLTLAQRLLGTEKSTEEKSELVNPSSASLVYMIAVTASSGGQVVLMDEIEESAEWEDGDFTEVDEDGDFEEYESDDDPLEDVDDTVVDMTDGDGVDIEDADSETLAYTVADYHDDAVAAYSETEAEAVEDDLPDEDAAIDDTIDDGDATELPDDGETSIEDDLPDEDTTTDELADDDYTLTDDNSDDESDEIEGAEVSDGYTVADCIGSIKVGDRVAVMVQNGKLTVVGVVGSGDEEAVLRQQAEQAADEASEAAADAQAKAEQAENIAGGAAQDASEAKEQAEAAKTAAGKAQTSAEQALTEAQEAAQKATDAEEKADLVEQNMAAVNAEVATVKEDAVKLRADMETEIQTVKTSMSQTYATKDEISTTETTLRSEFTESIAGIQTTFAQDYAKKTELDDAIVDAKAELQAQITVNANAISTAVKSVEEIKVDITDQNGKIAQAQQTAADAQTVADQAKTDASEAQTAASNAQEQAAAANTAATNAQNEANEAKSKADEAQSLADAAKSDLAKAEAKLAEVEENAAANAEDIAQAQQAVADAQDAVEAAQAAADKAKADAAAAQSTADQAKTDASNASTAASNAQTKADEAKTAADKAQAAADEAKEDLAVLEGRVTTAETTINQHSEAIELRATKTEVSALAERVSTAEQKITADAIISTVSGTYVSKTDASNTYSTKTELTQTSSGLEAKITTAQNTANNAAKTATNFLSYDATNGLLIGNKTSGSWVGSRAQILPTAFNILASDGTVLASYQASKIDLGVNDDSTIINLCGGNGSIKSTEVGSDWKRLTIESGDSVDVVASDEIKLETSWEDGSTYSKSYIDIISALPWASVPNANHAEIDIMSEYDAGDGVVYEKIKLSSGRILLETHYIEDGSETTASVYLDAGTDANFFVDAKLWVYGTAKFYDDVYLNKGNASIYGTTSDGAHRRIMTLNNNNNLVIGYDGYAEAEGSTNIYGDNINFNTNNLIYAHSTMMFDNTRGLRSYLSDGTTTAALIYVNSSDNVMVGGNTAYNNMYLYTQHFGLRLSKPDDGVTSYSGYFHPTVDARVTLGRTSNRWYRLYQSHDTVYTSDERQKENIVPLGTSPVMALSLEEESTPTDIHSELFDRLIPVQYNFIEDDARICYGLIAQQILSVMAELGIDETELDLVHHDSWVDEETGEEKDSYGIAYGNLFALIIHEVQKLKAQIA